ncbi:hypothetical protein HY612_00205 [Candidatus Roizmanbacteria bacterium]|nr:hypothetical protein [Candidatus Roizmanbacteria bacterium]
MQDSEPIRLSAGRLNGNLIESIFFGDSVTQLQKFWGINYLKELKIKDQIVLPESAWEYVSRKLAETQKDGYESEATFGWEAESLAVSHEGKSKTSLNDYIDRSSFTPSIEVALGGEGAIDFSWNRLFGKPHPIHFHTHPKLNPDDIKSLNLKFSTGIVKKILPSIAAKFFDFVFGTFSDGDMETYLNSQRYFVSALLGSNERLLYLVPPTQFLNVGIAKFNPLPHRYGERLSDINGAALFLLSGIDISQKVALGLGRGKDERHYNSITNLLKSSPTLGDLKKMRDQLLIDTATRAGYIVFASESGVNPRLERLRES